MNSFAIPLSLLSPVTVNFEEYPPRTTVATVGGDVVLKCNVSGVPRPRVVWKKQGELVTNTSRITVTTDVTDKTFALSQLRIRQVTKADVAVYSCISWNRGSVRSSAGRILIAGEWLNFPRKQSAVLKDN